MKITDVTVTLFAWPGIPATRYGRHTGQFGGQSQLGLVRILTDDGLEGHAFLGSAMRPAHLDAQSLIHYLKPIVLGQDPLERERLWQAREYDTAVSVARHPPQQGRPMMGQNVTLKSEDGHQLSGYRAQPAGKARGGIVIIQEIFGVNGHIKRVCDRYATEGYTALAPAVFDRVEPGISLGYQPEDITRGREIRGKVGWDSMVMDTRAAVNALQAEGLPGRRGRLLHGRLSGLAGGHPHRRRGGGRRLLRWCRGRIRQ